MKRLYLPNRTLLTFCVVYLYISCDFFNLTLTYFLLIARHIYIVGRARLVVGFTTTFAISTYHHLRCEFESCSGEVYSVQHYVTKFVSDLRQVGGFLNQ